MKKVNVIKKNGENEIYNEKKVIDSLKNSGADEESINKILEKLNTYLYNNISTSEIFKFVYKELRKINDYSSTRYNLKQAIFELSLNNGGYVFEKYIGKILESQGYKTKLNQIIKGNFIPHEIDVNATKENEKLMVECKHFSRFELGISIQTALYVYARFLDLNKKFNKALLATNTKFSPQVIKYSKGVGLKLMGWKYPQNQSLEKLIETEKIYPITILPLPKSKIKEYLKKDIITFQDLLKQENLPKKTKELINSLLE